MKRKNVSFFLITLQIVRLYEFWTLFSIISNGTKPINHGDYQ